MATYRATLTSNAATLVARLHRRKDSNEILATIYAYGTFGGGTIAWGISRNAGVTIVPMSDFSGIAKTTTANSMFNVRLGNPSTNAETIELYATLSGATNPSITVVLDDNT